MNSQLNDTPIKTYIPHNKHAYSLGTDITDV